MNFKRNIYIVLAMLSVMLGVSSCGTSRSVATAPGTSSTKHGSVAPPQHIDLSGNFLPSTGALLREADTWIGTSYRYGGNDRSGVDCSGLVVNVFNDALGIKLPRSSSQQQAFCRKIDREQLQLGDLVFFTVRGGSDVGHVGIYIGDDRMVHASSSKGVIISSLSSKYYVDNYHSSGRVEKYYALVDGERNAPQSQPAVATQPVVSPPVAPVGNIAMRVARIGHVSDAPLAAAPVAKNVDVPVVKPVEVPPVATDDGSESADSGLEELSEFFD